MGDKAVPSDGGPIGGTFLEHHQVSNNDSDNSDNSNVARPKAKP